MNNSVVFWTLTMDTTMIVLVSVVLVFPGPSCSNSDNIALLAGTLRTMQRAACDDEIVSLSCPPGTSISIQVAQYGKATSSHACRSASFAVEVQGEEKCLWPNSMQYSLLQTVVEACQKKPQCKFSTKSKAGQVDPCPHARKFVEVAYKCRPHEFRSRTGCEDDVIKLSCNTHSRVAIFDAQYGRMAYETNDCPQPLGVSEETCSASYAVETVMQICHGKRWCQIIANNRTFGSPCKANSKNYLKVVYACVPLGVLTERYESASEQDEINVHDANRDGARFDETDTGEKWREPNAVSPAVNTAVRYPDQPIHVQEVTSEDDFPTQKSKPDISGYRESSQLSSNTKFLIYISVGILIIIIVVALIYALKFYKKRRRNQNSKNGDMFTTDAPNVFNDAVSDIDNDVDVSHISGTFYDPIHPDMILYRDGPNRTTLRAMKPLSTVYPCAGASMYGNIDYVPNTRDTRFVTKEEPEVTMSPKSLGGFTNTQFYYG